MKIEVFVDTLIERFHSSHPYLSEHIRLKTVRRGNMMAGNVYVEMEQYVSGESILIRCLLAPDKMKHLRLELCTFEFLCSEESDETFRILGEIAGLLQWEIGEWQIKSHEKLESMDPKWCFECDGKSVSYAHLNNLLESINKNSTAR